MTASVSAKREQIDLEEMTTSPEGDRSCEPSLLAQSLETVAQEIEGARNGLEQRLSVTPVEEFAVKEAKTREHLLECYARCFTAVGTISKRNQTDNECRPMLDELVKKNYHMIDVREAYNSLIAAEEEWGQFLQRFEKTWAKVHPPYMEGQTFLQKGDIISPEHLELEYTSVPTKKVATLKDVITRSRYTLFLFFRVIG